MKKLIKLLLLIVAMFSTFMWALAAPTSRIERTLIPETDNTYDLGSTLKYWANLYANQICLAGDCKTAWPAGGGGGGGSGTFSTTTFSGSLAQYPYAQMITLLHGTTIPTSKWWYNSFTNNQWINASTTIGGPLTASNFTATSTTASIFPLANVIKLSNLTSNGFVKTSGGDGTLSVDTTTYESGLTAGDGLTRTANDFDCDTASGSVFGCLSSTDWTTFNGKMNTNFSNVSGTLGVANGGTASTTNLGGILVGNGASAIKSLVIGSNLTFDGTTLSATGGGGGASTTLLSDVNTFSGATTTFSNDINVGRYLHVGAPHDSQIEQDMASFIGDADDFRSVTLRNTNAGENASIDLLFNNDASTDTTNYADCGMNSSTYNVPAYGFQNVPNLWYCYTSTGAMSFSSATYIQFLVNGFDSEAIRFTQNGRISIGSTTPNSKLTITNASSDPTLWIESEENDTTPTVLTNSDRFGIATSSPWTTLSVNGIGAMDSIYTTNTTATSTFKGKIDADRLTSATMRVTGLVSCDTIDTDATGNFRCGSDSTGAGGAVTGNGIAGMMASWSSASNLIATSTIIGERVYATSTTATSTFLGSLAVGGATPDATFSVKGIGGKVAQFFTSAGTKLIDIANDGIITFLGVLNAGDATSFEIPNATSPTYGSAGIIALDTTANNLTIATSTLGHQVVWSATTTLYSFSMASTSPYFVSGATKMLPSKSLQQVVTTIWCKVDGGTSKVINLSDGTNDTNSVTCTTTGSEYPITTNATFTPAETINLEMGATTGTVNDLIIDIKGYRTSN